MTLNKVSGLILCSVLVLLALQLRSCQQDKAWEAKAKAAVAHADSVLAISAEQARMASAILRAAQAKDSAATRAAQRALEGRRRADSLAGPPDTPTVPREAYTALQDAYDTLASALATQQQATADLQLALQIEQRRGDGLASALESVTQTLRDRPRPQGPCGLGVGAGWGVRGPDAVVGVACRVALPRLHL